jgi:hypothetical protein
MESNLEIKALGARAVRRLTTACSGLGYDKVLGRGRSVAVVEQVMRARVLRRLRPAADANR